jgi:ferredoxin--NADP+ reductase
LEWVCSSLTSPRNVIDKLSGASRFSDRRHALSVDNPGNHLVVVIGAGPAGLFASRQLATQGNHVALLNRDIKPGGLAEYGIYHDKLKMKDGLRKQFRQILALPQIEYFGNVVVGEKGDLSLSALRAMGFQALLVTVGAQGTRWLGLPGEDLVGVYHAKDIVYHYNLLPPYSQQEFHIGKRVALIGAGNVMLDIAHWLVREVKVDEILAVVRRGPNDVKFTKKEMEAVACNLDISALDSELERVRPIADAVGQDVQEAKEFLLSALPKALEPTSATRFRFDFLASPRRILGGEDGLVGGLEVEDTTLICAEGEVQAKRLGTTRRLDVDTVIFCIGDKVEDGFGLPVRWNAFVKNSAPRFPVDGLSFEAFDPDVGRPIDRVFVAGWSREASSGLVGVARKDGENGAQAVLEYLSMASVLKDPQSVLDTLYAQVNRLSKPVVLKEHLQRLEEVEQAEARRLGLEEYKFGDNAAMFAAMGLFEEKKEN